MISYILSVILFFSIPDGVSSRQEKKLIRIAQEGWESKTVEIKQVHLRNSGKSLVPGFYYQVTDQGKTIGYMGGRRIIDPYLNYFPVFLFDLDFKVKKAALVEMNTIRGAEISSKAWLRQFRGYQGAPIKYGKDINAITGATLSGLSMVAEVQLIYKNFRQSQIEETAVILGQ